MNKFTLILAFVLCGILGVSAQKSAIELFPKKTVEVNLTQSTLTVSDNEETPKFSLNGKNLTAKNIETGTQIDIYSVLGAKVHSYVYKGVAETLNLSKGIYIIRAGKYTQKIIL